MNNNKFYRIATCLDKWMKNREDGKTIPDYCVLRQISSVGIYGYGILGKHLLEEFKNSGVSVLWVADRNRIWDDINVKKTNPAELYSVDKPELVIITSVVDYELLEKTIRDNGMKSIIHIEELVDIVYAMEKR